MKQNYAKQERALSKYIARRHKGVTQRDAGNSIGLTLQQQQTGFEKGLRLLGYPLPTRINGVGRAPHVNGKAAKPTRKRAP